MKRMIALLLLLCMLTACAAPVPETEEPTAASQEIAVPEQKQPDSGTMTGAATFTQAASEPLTYTVVLKTLEDSAAAADGTTLAVRSYELPEMTVTLPDGTVLTEAASPAETAALERAEAFNSRFRDWAGADGFDEVTAWAEEELAFRTESGGNWTPYTLELDCSVYQTEQMVCIQAEYYSYTGGAHPNTGLLAWNFDLMTGQFFAPEILAADGQIFLDAVRDEIILQIDMTPEAAVEAARKAKFQNLSLDLIYGLPHQTLEGWQKNLSAALDLTPEHLSCYGLKVEEGTPLFARRGTAGLPGDDAQADMYLYTVEFLKAQGYEQYEISNFAKPGCASRHNLKYWTLGEYAGFGPGAHSDFGGVRYAYTKDLEGYIRGVRDHAPMLSESDRIPPLDRDTEWVMLGLRTTAGLDPKAFERRFRRRFTCFLPFLDQCARAGYAVEEDGRWHLTPRGFLVSNQIIGGMLDALAADKQRRADAAARGDFRVNLD